MKVKLTQFVDGLFPTDERLAVSSVAVDQMTLDSRAIGRGDLFVAIKGSASDGRDYIEQAILSGAAAVLAESDHSTPKDGSVCWQGNVPVLYLQNLKAQLATLASRRYQQLPQYIIGVTGTNGKSTTTHLIASLAQLGGIDAAVMGTLGNGRPGQLLPAINTTADILTIYRQLSEFAQSGVQLVAMEVSSHGLDQGRVAGIPFSAGVFTNLTRDHLDYHGSMEAYGEAKAILLAMTEKAVQVVNRDDAFGQTLLTRYPQALSFSVGDKADWSASIQAQLPTGFELQLEGPAQAIALTLPLLGQFNVSNALAAIACLDGLKLLRPEMLERSRELRNVPGRMELFSGRAQVVVDYAHTPDALAKALQGLREHCNGRLFCIFGCGGDRDHGKRPLMAQAAERYADKVIITNDNPRTEDPQTIVDEICAGLTQPAVAEVILDRQQALQSALEQVTAQDMILLAGKGHEDYQIIGREKRPYDERRIVSQLVEETLC